MPGNIWDKLTDPYGGYTPPTNGLKFKADGTPDFQSDSIAGWTKNPNAGDIHWKDNPYASSGWFPIWKNSGGGQELVNQNLANQAGKREADLTNPNSKYYTDYLAKLKGTLSASSSLNSLLGLNKAMGISQAGSATLANEQRKAIEGRNADYATQATQQLWQSNTGQANSLLGMQLGNTQQMMDYYRQKQMYEDSQKFDWGQLIQPLATLAGTLIAPGVGTAAGSAVGGMIGNATRSNFNNTADYYTNRPWTFANTNPYGNH